MWKRSFFCFKAAVLFCVAAVLTCMVLSCSGGSAEPSDGEEYVSVTDDLGRQITVKKCPQRVAALIGSFADVWMLAGGSICATALDAWEDLGLELDGAVNIGGAHSPSLEKLLSSEPELCLASASTASNVQLCQPLEDMGITVVYFDVDSFSDYLRMLNICTSITGRMDLYEQNGIAVKRRVEQIKADISSIGLTERERTILLLRASSGTVKAKGSGSTVLGEMLSDIGCINIADIDRTLTDELSVESVIRQDPSHIFVVTMGSDTDAAMNNVRMMIEDDPAWGTLSAVKENRLHLMDRELFNLKPNARWADSYEKLYEIFLGKTQ